MEGRLALRRVCMYLSGGGGGRLFQSAHGLASGCVPLGSLVALLLPVGTKDDEEVENAADGPRATHSEPDLMILDQRYSSKKKKVIITCVLLRGQS